MSTLKQNFYKKHVFICTNMKEGGLKCCGGTPETRNLIVELKKHVMECGSGGEGGVRISNSGCLGRCAEGPVAVVYPEGKWVNVQNPEEVQELFELTRSVD